jgi:hypothetical protein
MKELINRYENQIKELSIAHENELKKAKSES